MQTNADKNKISAIDSILMLRFTNLVFKAKNDKIQLEAKHNMATPANSSKKVECAILEIFKEVKIIRQKPNKLEAAFKICGERFSILV